MPGTIMRRAWNRRVAYPLLACLVLTTVTVPFLAHAGEATMRFDIKSQPLSEALMAFGAQTQAIVLASSDLTAGKVSRPVTGQLTRDEALVRMLQGTGLRFEINATGAILIVRAGPPGSSSDR